MKVQQRTWYGCFNRQFIDRLLDGTHRAQCSNWKMFKEYSLMAYKWEYLPISLKIWQSLSDFYLTTLWFPLWEILKMFFGIVATFEVWYFQDYFVIFGIITANLELWDENSIIQLFWKKIQKIQKKKLTKLTKTFLKFSPK